jgi:hypothetical protein
MGLFVKAFGSEGYAWGYSVFVFLALASLIVFTILNRYATKKVEIPPEGRA